MVVLEGRKTVEKYFNPLNLKQNLS